jgi:hypothetical protein
VDSQFEDPRHVPLRGEDDGSSTLGVVHFDDLLEGTADLDVEQSRQRSARGDRREHGVGVDDRLADRRQDVVERLNVLFVTAETYRSGTMSIE